MRKNSGGSGISNFMDVLSFYNIIEIERPKSHGAMDSKRDIKMCRFWLKVEFSELKAELQKLIE